MTQARLRAAMAGDTTRALERIVAKAAHRVAELSA
jgi:hypothetical protein